MPLADLSIDDAIALACREVPDLTINRQIFHPLDGWPLRHMDADEWLARWFSTAWEWLLTFGDGDPFYRVVSFTDGWGVDSATYLGGGLESTSSVMVRLPTKYHALAAAVLLAAGKVVP